MFAYLQFVATVIPAALVASFGITAFFMRREVADAIRQIRAKHRAENHFQQSIDESRDEMEFSVRLAADLKINQAHYLKQDTEYSVQLIVDAMELMATGAPQEVNAAPTRIALSSHSIYSGKVRSFVGRSNGQPHNTANRLVPA